MSVDSVVEKRALQDLTVMRTYLVGINENMVHSMAFGYLIYAIDYAICAAARLIDPDWTPVKYDTPAYPSTEPPGETS